MELRSCGNSHFIQAVKNGMVVRTINIYFGKPSLRFKTVKDLYETKDSSFPIAVKLEHATRSSDEDLDSVPSDRDTEDLDFDSMSVTQLMDLFNTEKKQSKVASAAEERSDIFSPLTQENSDCEMLETIGSFKSRTVTNRRTKRRRRSADEEEEHKENPSVETEEVSLLNPACNEPADEDGTRTNEVVSVVEKIRPSLSPVYHGGAVPEVLHSDIEDQLLRERLISKRKAISPTSRNKLLEAMESFRLHDEEYYKCARKLCYENQTDNKANGEETNNCTNDSPHVDVLDDEDDGAHGCSNDVVLFSQKQMQGTKYIAAKLTKELNSLKNIVKETLALGDYSSLCLKSRTDEVNAAILNATREASSIRRLLHCMSRDCNRFCKIMSHKVAERPCSPASSKKKLKRKRKIIFADEAGGNLCEIKFFDKDDVDSVIRF